MDEAGEECGAFDNARAGTGEIRIGIDGVDVCVLDRRQAELSTNENPLLMKWEGPYGGVPPFDRVQISLFKPALEAAMAEDAPAQQG